MEINIETIEVEQRKRQLDAAKVADLAHSITAIGLLNPITVTQTDGRYRLVSGYHRLEAVKLLGWQTIQANIFDGDGLMTELAEIDENLIRNDLTVLEQSIELRRRNEILEELGQRAPAYRPEKGETVSPLKTTEDIAREIGLGERSTQYRLQIANNIVPEVVEQLFGNEEVAESTTQLLTVARMPKEMQIKIGEKIASGEAKNVTDARAKIQRESVKDITPPAGKYQVIYADPPWDYGQVMDGYGPAQRHYNTMTYEDLISLDIKELSTDNAALFLWVTSPKIEEGLALAKAWGFTYKAMFVWDKVKHNFGHYNSVRHELLLICTKGSFTPEVMTLHDSVQTIERTDEHSEKPEEFRRIIESLYPSASKIELFARTEVDGWTMWGDES
mgnify:CR=1 FL=1